MEQATSKHHQWWTRPAAVMLAVGFFILPIAAVAYWRVPCQVVRGAPANALWQWFERLVPTAYACLGIGGVESGGTGEPVCSVPGLSPLTDPLAQQMEAGQQVIWQNTHADLQPNFNALRAAIQALGANRNATVASAYRPIQYQNHLWEIADRWCTQQLSNPTSTNSTLCPALRAQVQTEKNQHFPTQNCPIVVSTANACASHTRGIALDISLTNITSAQADALAAGLNLNLRWPNITNDPYHWQLTRNLTPCP